MSSILLLLRTISHRVQGRCWTPSWCVRGDTPPRTPLKHARPNRIGLRVFRPCFHFLLWLGSVQVLKPTVDWWILPPQACSCKLRKIWSIKLCIECYSSHCIAIKEDSLIKSFIINGPFPSPVHCIYSANSSSLIDFVFCFKWIKSVTILYKNKLIKSVIINRIFFFFWWECNYI